jgi:hypothetical protein
MALCLNLKGKAMVDPLLPWAPFFYSFGPALFIIKILADWLKLRLYSPIGTHEQQRVREFSASFPEAQQDELTERYKKMTYQALRDVLVHPSDSGITSPQIKKLIEAVYLCKAQKRYHIHHFVFGIPLMFVSWGLFVYREGWWGLIVAGIVAALFLSELKELITQQWQP